VAELVDARDSKSRSQKECGFDSLHRHHVTLPVRMSLKASEDIQNERLNIDRCVGNASGVSLESA
jgi:hypothetical protein